MTTGGQTHGPDGQSWNRLLRPASVSRYDLVLAVIPMAFLVSAVASGLLGVTVRTALAVGALLGAAVVTDALFLNPPTGGGRRH